MAFKTRSFVGIGAQYSMVYARLNSEIFCHSLKDQAAGRLGSALMALTVGCWSTFICWLSTLSNLCNWLFGQSILGQGIAG